MPTTQGSRAVVIGAGMAGLSAAAALSGHFDHVTVIERDALPNSPGPRAGTPQCRHGHGLLTGGLRALCDLLPGFDQDLIEAGAVTVRAGLEVRFEPPGYSPFPQRDLGWDFYCASRPLNEFTLRRRVQGLGNVSILSGCRADELIAGPGGGAVTGVRFEDEDGHARELPAGLVVEASGSGALTLALLSARGLAAPPETVIGVDIGYATGVFALPEEPARGWKMLMTAGQPPDDRRGAILLAMEGGRSMVTLVGRGDDRPPGDWDGYMAFMEGLASPTLFQTLKDAERVGEVVRYRFAASVRRHFHELADFPEGLLPFGDAICRLNPAGGQGMSVAAQEARLLRDLLSDRTGSGQGLAGLAVEFFAGVKPLLDTPWGAIVAQDFQFPQTRGEPPANFEAAKRFGAALLRLAAEDAETHRLWQEVAHLMRPAAVYQDPAFVARVMAGPAS